MTNSHENTIKIMLFRRHFCYLDTKLLREFESKSKKPINIFIKETIAKEYHIVPSSENYDECISLIENDFYGDKGTWLKYHIIKKLKG